MKKAIFFPPSCSNIKENEFESCRGEGRTIMNIAFGFSLLNYECYIVSNWNITTPKKIWDNVYITNAPDKDTIYDIAFTYDSCDLLNKDNYIHIIVMTYAYFEHVLHCIKDNNINNYTIVCPIPSFINTTMVKNYAQYFPPLFPIPSVHIGFIPYKFKPTLPNLKVYIYHSSWSGTKDRCYINKQLQTIEFLKSKGYILELYIHTENEKTIEDCKTLYNTNKYDHVEFINNEKINYDGIIKTLQDVDLCITSGGTFWAYGGGVVDMISLGKPIIYIVDAIPKHKTYLNDFYKCPRHIIIGNESYNETDNKLINIFNNLEESYNCYRDQLSSFDFNNWKPYVENFLRKNYKYKLTINDFPEWNKKFVKDDFELNVLLKHLEFKLNYKILEIGCNDSELSNTLYANCCEVWGVDVLPNDKPKFKFIQGNFQDIYLPENYFDIIIDVSAIHHFGLGNYGDKIDLNADIISAKKIYRLLKPNGLFYSSTDCISTTFNPNVNNYYRQYNIEEFNNRIIKPSNFKIIEQKLYKNNTYPLTLNDSLDYSGSQMLTILKKEINMNEIDIDNNIEIIGITTCGTYPAWTAHTIASFYNHVDKIIVVNAGYNIFNPDSDAIHPLTREHNQIQKLDIDNKIIEYTPTQLDIDKIFEKSCNREKDECGRSTNMTFATQLAYDLPTSNKERWILKLDNDQILYQITRKKLIDVIKENPSKTGFRFAQYPDYHHDFDHIGSLPDEFTNDGSLFHKSIPDQNYVGQGSPGNIKTDQHPIYTIQTSHMRRISPPDVDKYEYFFKRYWYHLHGPNSIMELDYNRKTKKKFTDKEILKIANDEAISIINNPGNYIQITSLDERIPLKPPLVCTMTPLEYIKKGY